MSSSKGASNTNKTAHVMNLLRKSNPAEQPQAGQQEVAANSAAAAPASPAAPAAPSPQVPPILTSLHADAEVSSQIRDALADALEDELSEAAPPAAEPETPPAETASAEAVTQELSASPEEVSVPEVSPSETAETPAVSPAAPQPPVAPASAEEATPEPAPEVALHVPEVPPVSEEAEPEPSDEIPGGVKFINVMHYLTEAKADKYIKMFGLCSCERCRQDVIALALNHLESKYVVMDPGQFRILSDMYANRYSADITAQLLWACKTVMDNPRH